MSDIYTLKHFIKQASTESQLKDHAYVFHLVIIVTSALTVTIIRKMTLRRVQGQMRGCYLKDHAQLPIS